MIILIDFLIFSLDCRYYRGDLDYYDAASNGDVEYYLSSLLWFDFLIVIFNAALLFSSSRFLMNGGYLDRKIKFYLLYVIYLFNIVNGLLFSVKNYIRNYTEVFELYVFSFLIMKYGVVVNFIYILLFSNVYGGFCYINLPYKKIVVPFTKVGLREGRVVYPDAVAGIFFSLFTLNMKSY
ncbi:hypothetical protein C2U55_10455 [Enterobacteriaceae bacterium ENNIH3]|nr:hypothetical protein C2U55_10455 [Enterobacteriaceae bacterium ENNIH3]AUV05191.1 hypothetical protein C2U52_02255 [Enterobacteriaceae bacterium ENNIH2]PWF52055.1 hypothetical protein BHT19_0014380 [[Kluyvera] intestini]